MGRGVNLGTASFSHDPVPLDFNSKREVNKIHKMPYSDFVGAYLAPSPTADDYLDVRYAPSIWVDCIEGQSRSHLFLYSYCLAKTDPNLKELMDLREKAGKHCRDVGDAGGRMWLNMRPRYTITMQSVGERVNFTSWSYEVKGWMKQLAGDYRTTARLLLITYSSRVLLESGVDLSGWRSVLEDGLIAWKQWVETEKREIRRTFSFV